jgi:hypothetical protein
MGYIHDIGHPGRLIAAGLAERKLLRRSLEERSIEAADFNQMFQASTLPLEPEEYFGR